MPELRRDPALVRVLTYNVHDLKDDVDALARAIRTLQPDVACLQEVPRHPFSGHRVGALADACGLLWSGAEAPSGGTAVLTSLRVDQRAAHTARLPVGGRFARSRGYAAAVVAVPGGPAFTVASIHLGLDPQERVRHAEAVLSRVQRFGPAPYVVAGDLNEPPGGPAWRLLTRDLVDGAADEATDGSPTFPARAPRQRIDAVLASAAVVSVRVPGPSDGIDPTDLATASDHLPVVADLRLT
jgi:endonuclease/exonuclease/phosphatase family metal-dependent hydrolase